MVEQKGDKEKKEMLSFSMRTLEKIMGSEYLANERPRCRAIHSMSSNDFSSVIESLSWKDIYEDPCLQISIEGRKMCIEIRKEML